MVTETIFETALGISSPWFIAGMNFDLSRGRSIAGSIPRSAAALPYPGRQGCIRCTTPSPRPTGI